MASPDNIHTSSIVKTKKVIFGNMYVYKHTYTHVITIHEKRGNEFESSQGGMYGRLWREEREKFNYNLKIRQFTFLQRHQDNEAHRGISL